MPNICYLFYISPIFFCSPLFSFPAFFCVYQIYMYSYNNLYLNRYVSFKEMTKSGNIKFLKYIYLHIKLSVLPSFL